MIKKLLLCVISAMVIGVTSCSSDDVQSYEEMAEKISTYQLPQKLVEKNELPAWIAEWIDNIHPEAIVQISVDKFVWKDKTHYYFQSLYNQFLSEVYDENGNKIELLTGTEREELIKNSRDWVCIYLYSTSGE